MKRRNKVTSQRRIYKITNYRHSTDIQTPRGRAPVSARGAQAAWQSPSQRRRVLGRRRTGRWRPTARTRRPTARPMPQRTRTRSTRRSSRRSDTRSMSRTASVHARQCVEHFGYKNTRGRTLREPRCVGCSRVLYFYTHLCPLSFTSPRRAVLGTGTCSRNAATRPQWFRPTGTRRGGHIQQQGHGA